MITKNELKYYSNLKQKKYRTEGKKFIAEGLKQTEEGIKSNWDCEIILVTHEFLSDHRDLVDQLALDKKRIEVISGQEFNKISDTKAPQGILSVFKMQDTSVRSSSHIIVALEGINDPGNVGTIIRTCDWFGFSDILLAPECADVYNPKVVRSSMGSLFHVKANIIDDFYQTLTTLKGEGYKIAVADLDGIPLLEYVPDQKIVIVFCSESHGPSDRLLEVVSEKITIPGYGDAESLNVASAAAVILSHFAFKRT